MPRRSRLIALVLTLSVAASACGDDGDDDVIRLGNDTDATSLDDVQVEADPDTDIDITYATFDGGEANLTDFAGTPLVVNFFASWCASCVSEMPDFDAVASNRADEIVVLGLSEDVRAEDSLKLIERTGIGYPTGWDPDGAVFGRFGAFAMPTTVFITADGSVAHVFSGALDAESLDSLIDEFLV